MTPDDTPPTRTELADDVAARLRARGLDATRDGDNVAVYEHRAKADGESASTGRNIGRVVGTTFGSAAIALLLSLVWFAVVFLAIGREPSDAGGRAGAISFTMTTLFGGLGALFAGAGARTPGGRRDLAAVSLAILLGVPLLAAMILRLGPTMDALTRDVGKLGIVAAIAFFGVFALLGDRFAKKR